MVKIAVDGMGGDFAPKEIVEGVRLAINDFSDLSILLVGRSDELKKELQGFTKNIEIVHADEVITMNDKPREALLKKKGSSMHKAVELVRERIADGFVTAGNTGAYMAISLFTLGRLKDVNRPGIGVVIPFKDGDFGVIIDVGASVDIMPRDYLILAILGKTFLYTLTKNENLTVGLLNIGEEEEKGTKLVKEAYKVLKENLKEFKGNIEPHEILYHKADVIVTDGFTGNILEKSYEGALEFTVDMLKEEITKSIVYKIGALLLKPALKNAFNKLNYENFGGSPLLGVDGISVKAHGRSKRFAIKNAIKAAYELAKNNLIENFKQELEKIPQ
ncbi:phosphate acyltransferase PlsX [Caldisericum exile]|uniref:Phosphate acyltransferase n=1 Tax=Caldisericum exile (strain DSM 21853 / NBRC 104410 / AZM16c01) TaxID=511051 RepID=A0A7U6GEC2_CALEA|nr:phosphate acyltransferase PlsX [Caldisericum exile]BAL80833.1 acyl-ACP--phosphate acyltransferase [Caldisericum exile AZM16c01]